MNEYNGSELFGRHYNIFPGCYCCIRPTYIVAARKCHVIHMRRLGQSSCATVRDKKKGTTKSVESSLLLFQNKHHL